VDIIALGFDDGNDEGNELEGVLGLLELESDGGPFTVGFKDDEGDALGNEACRVVASIEGAEEDDELEDVLGELDAEGV